MKIKYFRDTDTLYIELKAGDIAETRDLDENSKSGPDGLPLAAAARYQDHREYLELERRFVADAVSGFR
jgi:hypothetical protein